MLIAGGGFAGLALAIALRQGLGDSFTVAVADPALGEAPGGRRARLGDRGGGAAAVRDHRRLGQTVAADAQPILDMVVTDRSCRTRCGRRF